MKQLLSLFCILCLITSCKTAYIKNKFRLVSFSVLRRLPDKNAVEIKFNVEYYSDSTEANSWAGGIEKGQDGSEDEIIFFGIKGFDQKSGPCAYLTFDNFKNCYNSKAKECRGQSFDFNSTFCIPELWDKKNELIMVLKNKNNNKVDTLQSIIPDG